MRSVIIFTTAHDEYALKAFKLNSIDYLLKPIDEYELAVVISKFEARNAAANAIDVQRIRSLFQASSPSWRERFTEKIGQQIRVIDAADVECFFSENKGTYLHTFDNRDYPLDVTLDALESDLNPRAFFRVSRKFIIPVRAVKELHVYSNSRLKIILPTFKNDEVVVSREKVSAFRNWLDQ